MSDNASGDLPYAWMLGKNRKGENTKAKRDFIEWSLPKEGNHLVEALEDGWSLHKTMKTRVKVRKSKLPSVMWEDTVWTLFSSYNDVSQMNDLSRKFDLDGVHQIDVFAHLPGRVLLVECKSREKLGKDPKLRDHILNLVGYREAAEKSIKEKYGKSTQISWAIATKNFEIPKIHSDLAKENKINLITEQQIEYFMDLLKKSGQVSIYQLLSYFFKELNLLKQGHLHSVQKLEDMRLSSSLQLLVVTTSLICFTQEISTQMKSMRFREQLPVQTQKLQL